MVTSSNESSNKDIFRSFMNSLCFGVNMKPYYDVAADRAMIVSAGKDSFVNILTGKSAGKSGDDDGDRAKSVFASSEADVQAFITATGVNKEAWGRFETTLSSVFGAASVSAATGKSANSADSANSNGDDGTAGRAGANNEYPEADIDECRQARDIVLEQYIQDAARREKLAARSAMSSSSSSSGNMAGGGGDDGTDRGSAAGGSKGYGGRADRDRDRENQGYGSRSSSDNLREASGNGREEKSDATEVDDRRRRK